jgi:Protein of unknown function (DUF3987)
MMDRDHAEIVNLNLNGSPGSSGSSAPQLISDSAALRGLPGDVVRALTPYTEADPAGLLLNILTCFGAMVGEMAEVRVGFAHHPPALFTALVGRTSRSRKGTATTETEGLMRHVEDGWHELHQVSGFGSGEGFIEHAASTPGSSIYLVETELARLLAVASREGSSVSPVMRAAWDFRRMEHRIRKQRYDAPAAPVSLVAHITMDELRDSRHGLRLGEIMNGFGNRILWCYVDRRHLIDNPERIPESELNPLVKQLHSALETARSVGVVSRTVEASWLWSELYERMASDDGAGVVDALTARAEAQLVRLSLIYALMDGSKVVDVGHLESAWEVWRYCRWSAQHIFVGSGTGDPDVDRIAAVLHAGEDISGRELDRMFFGRRSAEELREKVVALGVAEERIGESTTKGGRPPVWLTSVTDKPDQPDKPLWWRSPTYRIEGSSAHGIEHSRRSESSSGSSSLSAVEINVEVDRGPSQGSDEWKP